MFLLQLLIGMILICITVAIHALALDYLMHYIDSIKNKCRLLFKRSWKIAILMIAVLGPFCAHIVEIWLWALFYIGVGALNTLEESLYFSTITFTTVGFGDIVLDHNWRLVSSFQAANGFILFGWSAAFIFEIMTRLYEPD